MNPYIADILAQPSALMQAITETNFEPLISIKDRLNNGAYDRLIISGMGSSLNAAYPAYLQLTRLSQPALWLNGAELLHSLQQVIGKQTLLWLNSQSGKSAELINLIGRFARHRPATILVSSNDLSSPLAKAADFCLPINAGYEATVSTKTYINMLAVNLLTAEFFINGEAESLRQDMLATAQEMETYLSEWRVHLEQLDGLLGEFASLMFLGRGSAMAAVWNGSLINKEAAESVFEGMHAADFRHGPLELVAPGFTALFFAGSPHTVHLNRRLALEIESYGGRVIWLDDQPDTDLTTFLIPKVSERTRPLMEILPLQMLSVIMAGRKNIEPGHFRYVGKITETE